MAEDNASKEEPKKKSGKKRVVLAIVVVILIGLGVFTFLPTPAEEELTLNPKNSEIYSALVAVGIEEAFVDATEERVIVAYDLPSEIEKEVSWYYIMGTVASIAPDSEKVIIQAFVNDEATEEVTVQMKDIIDFLNERITEEEFKSRPIIQ